MKQIMKYGSVLLVAVSLTSCMYPETSGSVTNRYAILYGSSQWQQDTGWSKERAEAYTIPLWHLPPRTGERVVVDRLPVGATVRVVSKTVDSFQVIHPETGNVGWLDRVYIERTFSRPPVSPTTLTVLEAQAAQQSATTVNSDTQAVPASLDSFSAKRSKRVTSKKTEVVIADLR